MWEENRRKNIQVTLNGVRRLYLDIYAYMVVTIVIKGKETRNVRRKKRGHERG